MTANNAFKKQVRAYAEQHGLSYADARTRLLNLEAAPAHEHFLYQIQQTTGPDFSLPMPLHVDGEGIIEYQDFWLGTNFSLLGFTDTPEPGSITLPLSAWMKSTDRAIGMYPVTTDIDGTWSVHTLPVASVTIYRVQPEFTPDEAHVLLTADNGDDLLVPAADALAVLPVGDLEPILSGDRLDTVPGRTGVTDILRNGPGERADVVDRFMSVHDEVSVSAPGASTWLAKRRIVGKAWKIISE